MLVKLGEVCSQGYINGHRAGIIKDGQSLLYKYFCLLGHSVAEMKV